MEMEDPIPVLYFTQLLALALGLSGREAALDKNMVDPRPLLRERGILTPAS
jgi:heterodisulfide reductase subunit B